MHDVTQVLDAYSAMLDRLAEKADKQRQCLHEVLSDIDLKDAWIECRTKSLDSLAEKVNRPNKAYLHPLAEITDLIGCRVICPHREDVEIVSKEIYRRYRVDHDNSVDVSGLRRPREFGYSSNQIIIFLDHLEAPDLTAEIQVKTTLQHVWASVEHKLQYKHPDVPSLTQRRLARLAALLEAADEEFSRARLEVVEAAEDIEQHLQLGNPHLPLINNNLRLVINQWTFLEEIISGLGGVGVVVLDDLEEVKEGLFDALGIYDIHALIRRVRDGGDVGYWVRLIRRSAKPGSITIWGRSALLMRMLLDGCSSEQIRRLYQDELINASLAISAGLELPER